jgi:hypothetical protein
MTCQSWWCGGDVPVEVERAPAGARLTLACGCIVLRIGTARDSVPIQVESARCEPHRIAPPAHLPPGTRARLDLLSTLLAP